MRWIQVFSLAVCVIYVFLSPFFYVYVCKINVSGCFQGTGCANVIHKQRYEKHTKNESLNKQHEHECEWKKRKEIHIKCTSIWLSRSNILSIFGLTSIIIGVVTSKKGDKSNNQKKNNVFFSVARINIAKTLHWKVIPLRFQWRRRHRRRRRCRRWRKRI